MTKRILTYGLIFYCAFLGFSQEDIIVSHSRFMQKVNPSAFGMNSMNKTGVLYNSLGLVGNTKVESKYFFGALSFDRDNFSLGVDVYSLTMDNVGMTYNKPSLNYVYKIQLDNELYFLPSVSLGFGSNQLDNSKLIFEDQLSLVSGYLQTESQDPLASNIGNANYLDLGASFIIHSSYFLFGGSIKHLNQPIISYNNEDSNVKLPIRYSIQGGYEFDVNPYDRTVLPRYSTILAFFNASKRGDNLDFFLSQEAQLGEFSIGLNQQFRKTQSFGFTNIGMSVALAYENFEFGALYNFPFQNPLKTTVYSPSTIEVFLTFDFSPYLRNKRGDYRRISIDNYY
ncbi:type IX secretion system membrane protein PorP/SprF [Flavobacteriaceae bacterium]|jgi:type IX secretion system PorP/SprF family membrane protein|nr:type IX secretion system membrane protein PorP/SprF [Flavobacteriaceae bacterium]MDA8877878.1 type IX secretion system membrane protein PorP/SprF [Flavobacteriaceae bacterium]MDA9851528.1 type IX secretion system membrane protein PorP/SprF [Flavobacteriaceae bacterium]MDC0386206.1 type IX secretion system membrane protein PorP/SprF [Flavobacteriaceae bacterium]MDC0871800.1 type IX secretion system membrane protein PorP/SprF [Flavobacteriaceae bacterium]